MLSRAVAFLAIALVAAPRLAAQPLGLQASSAERSLFVVARPGDTWLQDDEQILPLSLPPAARLSAVEALADGWLVAGTAGDADSLDLLLLAKVGERIDLLPQPRGAIGRFATRPVPLIEKGALAGLAWLEGDRYDALAVRAAAWEGDRWSGPETVSLHDLGSQLALSGAVLGDGSWLLVWSAVDGEDDEIFWSRREVHGRWNERRRLTVDNDVPDIHPSVVATPTAGALVSWNAFDGSDYRVRLARLDNDGWRDGGFLGSAGSIQPSLLESEAGAYLVYQSVLPQEWMVVELDEAGRAWRWAAADLAGIGPPMVTAGENGVAFRWPEATAELALSSTTVPWRTEPLPIEPPEARAPQAFSSAAESGAVVYRAFGDSILRASGDPVAPSIVFDVGDDGEPPFPGGLPVCAPDADPFAILCGLNWRLEAQLDGVFASDVANDGKGGEATTGGVSRIQSVLDDGGDVVLLMEATNDITPAGTSNVTILSNLETMIDKATASGFDLGLASVIKRRQLDAGGNPVADPLNEQQTEDLRNSIANNLAPAKSRVHIDAWSALDPGLGQADYWNGVGTGDCCGHPDQSGYDKLEPVFRNAILADPALAAPGPIAPSGGVGVSPTFTWSTSGNSRLYQLAVTGPGGTSETWHDSLPPPAGVCTGGTCSVSLGSLGLGSYSWKVRGKNLRGPGPFSADLTFEVLDCGALPADIFLDADDTGSQTYHACPGSVTAQVGFVVATGETVTLYGTASVVIEGIEVQNGATLTLRSE